MYRFFTALLFCVLPAAAQAGATLHSTLPADAVAYLRITSADGFPGAAPDTALGQALTSLSLNPPARTALLDELDRNPQLGDRGVLLEFVYRLTAPVEAVVLQSPGQTFEQSTLLLRGGLDAGSINEVNRLFERIDAAPGGVGLMQPMDEQGYGMLVLQDIGPVFVRFDPADRSLYLMLGTGADFSSFKARLAGLTPSSDHPMYALEQRIDTASQGPFLWLDVPRLLQGIGSANIDPTMMASLATLQGVQAAALGWGTRDDKGRLSLVIDAPKATSLNQMLPAIVNDFSLTTRGNPGFVITLNIPGPALLRTFEGFLAADPQAFAEYQAQKLAAGEALGLEVDRLVGTLGPEMVLFSDAAGLFLGLRVADPDGLNGLLQRLIEQPDVDYETRTLDGRDYHHLAFSVQEQTEPAQDPFKAYLDRLAARVKTHLYWVQEDDWLIFAQVPQPLFDRARNPDVRELGDWLRSEQRQRSDNALLLVSAELDQIPRKLYYGYLEALEMFADLAGTRADLFSRPSAGALQLPETGSYGLQLDLSDPYLTLELSFESNPLEFLFGANATTSVAVVGILAAIAVPSYQDYVRRARVAEGMTELAQAKAAVTAYYMTYGVLPNGRADVGLSPDESDVGSPMLTRISIENGRIEVEFSAEVSDALAGSTLNMTPYGARNGGVLWRCGYQSVPTGAALAPLRTESGKPTRFVESTADPKYLPASCR